MLANGVLGAIRLTSFRFNVSGGVDREGVFVQIGLFTLTGFGRQSVAWSQGHSLRL